MATRTRIVRKRRKKAPAIRRPAPGTRQAQDNALTVGGAYDPEAKANVATRALNAPAFDNDTDIV